jgi:Ala-tRNA(Pro) deacylase
MPSKKLKEFLDQSKVKYVTIKHSLAYTSQEIAASAHIRGKDLAKTVIVKVDGKMILCVLPASYKIDFEKLKEEMKVKNARLANELEFKDKFPECEVGAMPPFGNLYGLDVYSAESLADDEEIAFNAGTHTELIQMKYKDYIKLVNPKLMKFSFQTKL